LKTLPLASQRNFAAAVRAVGTAMDKDADVLLLLMTSHGDRRGFILRFPDTVTSELTPQEVAETLDKEASRTALSSCPRAFQEYSWRRLPMTTPSC
jgi:hypothetical protein